MNDLDAFRLRIRNWARVFRDSPARGESNLMPYLRSIDKEAQKESEPHVSPDYRDAEFVDECIKSLRTRSEEFDRLFLCIKAEYLIKWEVPESLYEEQKLVKKKAAIAKVFWWRFYDYLKQAETLLMQLVEKREQNFSESDYNAP